MPPSRSSGRHRAEMSAPGAAFTPGLLAPSGAPSGGGRPAVAAPGSTVRLRTVRVRLPRALRRAARTRTVRVILTAMIRQDGETQTVRARTRAKKP